MKKFLSQCLREESDDARRKRDARLLSGHESWWDTLYDAREETRRQRALEQSEQNKMLDADRERAARERVEMAQERAKQWVLENPAGGSSAGSLGREECDMGSHAGR